MYIVFDDTRSKSMATKTYAGKDVLSRKEDEDEDEEEDFDIGESEEEEKVSLDGFVVEDDIPGLKER